MRMPGSMVLASAIRAHESPPNLILQMSVWPTMIIYSVLHSDVIAAEFKGVAYLVPQRSHPSKSATQDLTLSIDCLVINREIRIYGY